MKRVAKGDARAARIGSAIGPLSGVWEGAMSQESVRVLLIEENPQGSLYLAKRLQGRGCECGFAVSYEEACSLLRVQGFDLVLSPMRLPGGSAFSLVALLEGSRTSLFYFEPVGYVCWWLPALRNGSNCFGSSALLPSEFFPALDEVIDEIRFRAAIESKQPVGPPLRGSAAVPPSAHGESPPPEPKRVKDLDRLQRKAAG